MYDHLKPVNPFFDTPAPVELLLCADIFPRVWYSQQIQLCTGLPTPYSSVFGWVLIGPVLASSDTNPASLVVSLVNSIEAQLKRFWTMEESAEAPLALTDEGMCEELFIKKSANPPLRWCLRRIVELLPGFDNVIRVVKFFAQQGELIRPVVELVVLPTE